MRSEMYRMWDSFFEEKPGIKMEEFGEWIPALDLSETKNELVAKAEIPGVDPKDIDISLNNDILTVQGEKKQEKEEKDENYHFVERTYGAFTRSIRLPKDVQGDKIKASYKEGVLRIALPKSEDAKKKEIKIKVE